MKKSMQLASALLVSSAVWLAASAFAFEKHGSGGACKADVEKFCSDVSGGRRAIGDCLRQHQSDLSTECQAKLEKFAEHSGRLKACRDDVEKLCANVEHRKGQIRDCLRQHESEVSDGCRAALEPQS